MSRPPLPVFATTGGANVVEPSAGLKASGWLPGTRGPAQEFNWLHHTTHAYLAYLESLIPDGAVPLKSDTDLEAKRSKSASDVSQIANARQTAIAALSSSIQSAIASGGTANGPQHVIVGVSGAYSLSIDRGRTFGSPGSAGSDNLLAITYNPIDSTFTAVGLNATASGPHGIQQSNNVVSSWTARSVGGGFVGDLYDVLYFAPVTLVVAVGSNAALSAGEIQTATGGTYTHRTPPAGTTELRALATDGTTLVAVGAATADGRVIKSTDGTTWTTAATITGAGLLKSIVWHAGLGLWFCASDTNIWSSPNLTTWTDWGLVLPTSHVFSGLVALEQCVAAFHYNSINVNVSCQAKISPDGANWYSSPGFGSAGGGVKPTKIYPFYPGATNGTREYALWISNLIAATSNISNWRAPSGLL